MDSAGIQHLVATLSASEHSGRTLLRETHISWVILSGAYAYKIKKPLNLVFLDFSSLELRHHFCQEELRLNRRFSPELYLAVVAVTEGENGPALEGDGQVIDYAVKMRRFSEEQLLDVIAAGGGLDRGLLRALALELARVHDTLPACRPDPDSAEPGTPLALQRAIEQNFEQIRQYALPEAQLAELRSIREWSQQRFAQLLPLLEQRLHEGKVIDGHGDAHLGNIAFIDGTVRLFDCIEFNPAFRVMDSISEIAFLAMDMAARGYHGESRRLLTDYLEYSGDYAGLPALGLFWSYFAMVRAKVSLLREPKKVIAITTTHGYRDFLRYLQLANAATQSTKLFLAIMHGVSGSGKSTVAGALVEQSGAVRIRSDVERKRLAGLTPEQRSEPQQRDSLYSAAMSRETFARLENLASMVIGAGFPVIVDATFLHQGTRDTFHALARSLSVPFVIVDCIAEPEQMRQRLAQRARHAKDASEADVAVMERQLQSAQGLTEREQAYSLAVDSSEDGATLWRSLKLKFLE